jgi:hypothetical protein
MVNCELFPIAIGIMNYELFPIAIGIMNTL